MEIVIIIGVILLIWALWPSKKLVVSVPEVKATSFFELNAENREVALNYAWSNILKKHDSVAIKTIGNALYSVLAWGIAILFSVITLFMLDSHNPNGIILTLPLALLGIYKGIQHNRASKRIRIEDQKLADRNHSFAKLAQTFISQHVEAWIDSIKSQQIESGILEVTNAQPDETYILTTEDMAFFSEANMPPKSIGLTYVLVGQYMTVVDKISMNIKETSYLYITTDTPSMTLVNKEEWTSEEFHYRDIIEIGYNANDGQGNLFISLVNGTQKEYLTSKKYVNNLFNDVRTRVREAKIG